MPQTPPDIVKPQALTAGDTVGIIAPSSPMFEEGRIEFTYRWLERLGFKWKVGKHLFDRYSDLAGKDDARLDDLHSMWSDPEVKAILPVRGGNGSVRLLPEIDFKLIGAHPKILIGYSDITGLLIPIHQETGLVTFHGPTAGSFFDSQYTCDSFVKALTSVEPAGPIEDPPSARQEWQPQYPPPRLVISEGSATGRLTGGCMTLVRQLMGSQFEIDTRGKLLFLEDVGEEPHSIDRMVTQLELAGKLTSVAGIIFGECVSCKPGNSRRARLPVNFSVERMLRERFGQARFPVVYGMRIGHSKERTTLPLGVEATLTADSENTTLTLNEPATREASKR